LEDDVAVGSFTINRVTKSDTPNSKILDELELKMLAQRK
jgi:hypothetical protein